jgi:lipoprotein-anchoring transpeptidase ErfK/SrfK
MKYWMRLTWDGVGHHIGPIPSSRRPVSHGCIRGYHKAMPEIYAKVKVGTPVTVQ